MKRLLSVIMLLIGCGPIEVVDRDPRNVPILIRSPQPSAADIIYLYQTYSIKTVINLRGYHPNKDWFIEEARGVERIGAEWIHFNLSGRSQPRTEDIKRLLEILSDPANRPVLIHCAGGIHRTGLVVAIYRIHFQGWSAEQALEELEDNWFD